jgi:hypothetical protein
MSRNKCVVVSLFILKSSTAWLLSFGLTYFSFGVGGEGVPV